MEIKLNSNKMTINKVLLAHSPIIEVYIISVVSQQQSHDSDNLAHKAQNIHFLTLYKKKKNSPTSGQQLYFQLIS